MLVQKNVDFTAFYFLLSDLAVSLASTSASRTGTAVSSSGTASGIRSFFDHITEDEKESLDALLAKAIYSSGVPFAIVDNSYWKDFFKKLRPCYDLPSRFKLSHGLLETEYKEIKATVQNTVRSAQSVGVQCDGWSNIRNQAIFNFIVTTPSPILYKTMCTEAERHTGEYIAQEINTVLEEIGPAKVIGIISDSAAAMEKAKKIIHEKYPYIQGYPCAAHILNLLVNDIMKLKSFKNIEISCKEIVKEITSSHITLATFNKIQMEKSGGQIALKLPVKTRWGSILKTISSLLQTKYALQLLIIMNDNEKSLKISSKVGELCKDNNIFWPALENMKKMLEPIVKWLTILEGDGQTLSLVVEAFNDLQKEFSTLQRIETQERNPEEEEEEDILDILNKRRKMCLLPIHFAANLLDPKFTGQNLSPQEHLEAMKFLSDLCSNNPRFEENKLTILNELSEYCAKSGLWANDFLWQVCSSVSHDSMNWWKGFCKKTELKNIALAVLGLPASSAATERSFSRYGFLHSAKRNKLTVERGGKLVYCSHYLSMKKRNENLLIDEGTFGGINQPSCARRNSEEQPPPSDLEVSSSDSDSEASEAYSVHDTDSSIGQISLMSEPESVKSD